MTQQTNTPATTSARLRRRPVWWFWTSLVAVLFLIAGGVTYAVYWYNNLQTYHLAAVQAGVLYRDGNRDLREFKHAVAATHAKTIVSLVDDQEVANAAKPQFQQETDYCVANGIQYIRIPVKLGGWPSSDDLKTFLNIVTSPANQPVLVHCAQGVRRTGMFVAAYQETVQHESAQQARDAIQSFRHKQSDTDDVRRFIDAYDPVKQTVPPLTGTSAE